MTVRLGESVDIDAPGITRAVVLDDDVCSADVSDGTLHITGARRGDTVVIGWAAGDAISFLVHVDAPAPPPVSPGLTQQELDAVGHGSVGTLAHVGSSSAGDRSYSFLTPFSWTQGTSERRFTLNGQVQSAVSSGAGVSNLDTVAAEWRTPQATVDIADFALALDGGDGRVAPARPDAMVGLRGGQVIIPRGRTTVAMFAGATAPWFAGSREIAGATFRHAAEDERTLVYGTTGWLRVPRTGSADVVTGIDTSVFQTAGVRARLDSRTVVDGAVGLGSSGAFVSGAGSWQGDRVSTVIDVRRSSPGFALNQLQLVFAAADALRADIGWKAAARLGLGASSPSRRPSSRPRSSPLMSIPGTSPSTAVSTLRRHRRSSRRQRSIRVAAASARAPIGRDGASTLDSRRSSGGW